MFKRGILLFFLFSGILSCFCDDIRPFWEIENFDLFLVDVDGNKITADTINANAIDIVVDIEFEYVSNNSLKSLFVNTAMAADCGEEGQDGLKNPITKITLTCDQDYNDFDAGESLNDIVRYGPQIGFQQFIDSVKDLPAVDFFIFAIIEKPTNIDSLQFNLQIEFESGNQINKNTRTFYWQ